MSSTKTSPAVFPSLAIAGVCIIPVVIFAIITGWNFPMVLDEQLFHLPTVIQFFEQFPLPDISKYSSASGPLPFYLITVWTKLWGLTLPIGRSLSLLASFCALFLFDLTRRKLNPPDKFPTTILLSLTPYFILAAVSLITINYCLIAEIAVIYAALIWLRKPNLPTMLGIFLLLLIIAWSRLVSLAIVLPLLWMLWRSKVQIYNKIGNTLLMLLGTASFLPLFLLWQGFSPPVFRADYQANQINPAQFTLSLCMAGLYLAPIALSGIKRWGGMWSYGLFGGLCALLFPIPIEGNFGPVVRVLQGVSDISPTLKTIAEFVLATLGMWVVLGLWGEKRDDKLLLGIFFAYALALMLAPNVWEHLHYIIWVPLMLLLATSTWVSNWQRYGALIITGAIGLMMYYQLYLGI